MNTINKTSRILGFAFLFQFVTSISSGVFLKSAWFVSEDMSKTMLKIADNPLLFRANIFWIYSPPWASPFWESFFS